MNPLLQPKTSIFGAIVLAAGLLTCASSAPLPPSEVVNDPVSRALGDPDRSPEDRAVDAARLPDKILISADVAPGQSVAHLLAGGGYLTEMLARVVGPKGRMFGQNTREGLARFAERS